MKLIGISENKRFIKEVLILAFFKKKNIIYNISYYFLLLQYKYIFTYFINLLKSVIAPVAQLDRALGYGPGGSGFKS